MSKLCHCCEPAHHPNWHPAGDPTRGGFPPVPEHCVDVPVSLEALQELKVHYKKSKRCRIIFSTTGELLVMLPNGVEILYYQAGVRHDTEFI